MEITVGTFNLNNLFSRFNFKARVDHLRLLPLVVWEASRAAATGSGQGGAPPAEERP